jgi:hypothetical protein
MSGWEFRKKQLDLGINVALITIPGSSGPQSRDHR